MCSVTPVRVVSCPGHRLISYFLDLISKQLRSSSALSRRQSERPLWRLLLLWLVLIQVGGREVPPLLLNFVPHTVKEVFLSEESSRLHSSSRLSLSPALHRDVRVLSLHSLFYFSISLRR